MNLLPTWLLALMVIVGLALIWLMIYLVFVKPKSDKETQAKTQKSHRIEDDVERTLRQLPQDRPTDLTVVRKGDPADASLSDSETAAAAEKALSQSRSNGKVDR